jgi:hypothetical protein
MLSQRLRQKSEFSFPSRKTRFTKQVRKAEMCLTSSWGRDFLTEVFPYQNLQPENGIIHFKSPLSPPSTSLIHRLELFSNISIDDVKSSLTSALDGGEWSASRPGCFTPKGRAPGTHWIGGWVGPRAILDAVVKRKIPSPSGNRTLEPRSAIPLTATQPVKKYSSLWNPKFHYRFHKIPPLGPIVSQPNPVRPIDPYLPNVHLNVILPPTPRSSQYEISDA